MQEREMAKRNMILLIRSGSHLYGTNTPESDIDKVGVFLPDIEYILGFKKIEQVDLGKKSKDDSGRNTTEAEDCVLYALDKFVRLALDNNPNILELLFVNKENILFCNDIGYELLNLNKKFVSQNLKHRFLGYAFSQKHKMIIKLSNYEKIEEAIFYLTNVDEKCYINEIVHPLIQSSKMEVRIGDVKFPANLTVKTVKKRLEERIKRFGNRKELITKYGYDTKFASHLIRLLYEGIELLKTGKLLFPLFEVEYLKAIKNGAYTIKEIINHSEELEKQVEELLLETKVPHSPDREVIEEFLIDTYRSIVCTYD